MSPTTLAAAPAVKRPFPTAEVEGLLRRKLEEIAEEGGVLHPWEPRLDSFSVVGVISALEALLNCRLPPDKVIRRGGYPSVEEGVRDMAEKVRRIWTDNQKRKKGRAT